MDKKLLRKMLTTYSVDGWLAASDYLEEYGKDDLAESVRTVARWVDFVTDNLTVAHKDYSNLSRAKNPNVPTASVQFNEHTCIRFHGGPIMLLVRMTSVPKEPGQWPDCYGPTCSIPRDRLPYPDYMWRKACELLGMQGDKVILPLPVDIRSMTATAITELAFN